MPRQVRVKRENRWFSAAKQNKNIRIHDSAFFQGSTIHFRIRQSNFADLNIHPQFRYLDPLLSSVQGSTIPGFSTLFYESDNPDPTLFSYGSGFLSTFKIFRSANQFFSGSSKIVLCSAILSAACNLPWNLSHHSFGGPTGQVFRI